jgi:molybdopterin-guanine dinucleotide biosynthesis protein MobB
MERARCIGFVGPSGVGKTSLLEHLIPVLRSRGWLVGAVKHASHGFLADHRGKDSHRLYESGAEAVALISNQQLATFERLGREGVSLDRALASLPEGLDVVLVEGFSWEPIPRVVLAKPSQKPLPEHLGSGEVLRILYVPTLSGENRPCFSKALLDSLAGELGDHIRGLLRAPEPVERAPRAVAAALAEVP